MHDIAQRDQLRADKENAIWDEIDRQGCIGRFDTSKHPAPPAIVEAVPVVRPWIASTEFVRAKLVVLLAFVQRCQEQGIESINGANAGASPGEPTVGMHIDDFRKLFKNGGHPYEAEAYSGGVFWTGHIDGVTVKASEYKGVESMADCVL